MIEAEPRARTARCSGPGPKACMGGDGMLARLEKVTEIRMAGQAAKEYTYDRQTVSGSRGWTEVISVLNVKGNTYGVIAKIPHPDRRAEYLSIYRQIRSSFRLLP